VLGGVFISYRREDSGGFAGRIYDRLTRSLGEESVFFDVDSIAPGLDFVDTLSDRLGRCDAVVAVIGRSWLSSVDANSRRRLDDPTDYVRLEIGAALQRSVRVIPVLVDGAALPKDGDLPECLAKLIRRQAVEISLTRFDSDVERLIEALSAIEQDLRHGSSATSDHAGSPAPVKDDGPALDRIGSATPSSAAPAQLGFMALTPSGDTRSWRPTAPVVGAILGAGAIIAAALLYANLRDRGPTAHPWKPSFDCRLASGKTELMVCDNEQLSELDNALSVLYYTIRKSLTGDDQRQLDSVESVWVAERNTCSSDFKCVKKMYDDRIDELKKKMATKASTGSGANP
jgi:uncharacterized protein YecT (DUF1311 family)